MKESFIAALKAKEKVLLTFRSKEDQGTLVRTCAPMDFGPSRKAHDKSDRFHLRDYDSDKMNHTLSLLPSLIHFSTQTMEVSMIDEVSGNKLIVHENHILVSASQRPQVEAILKENGCSGEWFPSVGGVRTFSGTNDELGEVAIWSVWLGNIDSANIQSALDKFEQA